VQTAFRRIHQVLHWTTRTPIVLWALKFPKQHPDIIYWHPVSGSVEVVSPLGLIQPTLKIYWLMKWLTGLMKLWVQVIAASYSDKSVFSFLRRLSTWRCPHYWFNHIVNKPEQYRGPGLPILRKNCLSMRENLQPLPRLFPHPPATPSAPTAPRSALDLGPPYKILARSFLHRDFVLVTVTAFSH